MQTIHFNLDTQIWYSFHIAHFSFSLPSLYPIVFVMIHRILFANYVGISLYSKNYTYFSRTIAFELVFLESGNFSTQQFDDCISTIFGVQIKYRWTRKFSFKIRRGVFFGENGNITVETKLKQSIRQQISEIFSRKIKINWLFIISLQIFSLIFLCYSLIYWCIFEVFI